jgi:ribosomal protein L31
MAHAAQATQKQSPPPFYIELLKETHPFYTCGDLVRGVVRIEPTLRPKRISVTFRGFSVIYDQSSNGATPKFFRHDQDLFVSSGAHENFDILQRGTAIDGKVELPFEFTFPHTVSLAPPSDRPWKYSHDSYDHPRFQHSPGFQLPPSCTAFVSAKGPLAPQITYTIEACVESVNSDSPRTQVRQDIKFLPPAPEYDMALLQPDLDLGLNLPKHCCRYKFIRTRKLLPGYQGSSKLGRVKDMLVEKELFFGLSSYSEIPFVRFNLLATPARILVIGAQIPIITTVQHLDRSSSLPGPPDLFLRRVRVQLLSALNTFTTRSTYGSQAAKETIEVIRDAWTLFDKKFDDGNGEPLIDGLNLADLGEVRLAHEKLLPSFTSYGLALEYELQVEIWGECAKHEFSGLACRVQVQVVSGWNAASSQNTSSVNNALATDSGTRPEYHEVDPMAASYEFDIPERRHQLHAGAPRSEVGSLLPSQFEAPIRPMPPPYVA